MDTNGANAPLSKRSAEKTSCPKNFQEMSRNFALTLFCNMIAQSNLCFLHIMVFFGEKTKSPCFDLFIHWLIKQTTNNYRNHFSRSYKNRSNMRVTHAYLRNDALLVLVITPNKWMLAGIPLTPFSPSVFRGVL